jgi:CspA family cold shock protein
MNTGVIRFFDPRGFGFIIPDSGNDDVYFHVSELPGKRGARFIEEGTQVTYELGSYKTNIVAKKVRPIAPEQNGGSDGRQ